MSPPIRDGSGNDIGAIRLGDGSEISEVRTGAGDVLFSAAIPIPDSVVDTFEDYLYENQSNTLTDYYGLDTGNFTRQTNTVIEGSTALESTSQGGILSTSGLPNYVSQGDTVQVWLYAVSGSKAGFAFMASGSKSNKARPQNGYVVQILQDNTSPQTIRLTNVDNGSNVDFADSNFTPPPSAWFRFELVYDGSTVSCDIFDSSGNSKETISISPSQDRSATNGIYFGQQNSNGAFFDGVKIL